MILDEFEAGPAVIEPADIPKTNKAILEVCETMILPFSGRLFQTIQEQYSLTYGGYISNINGKYHWYIYEEKGQKVALMQALLGSPALVGELEELQEIGFKRFIIFGTCGVLDASLSTNKLIIPTSSVRDEGTSYHYAPASDEMAYPKKHMEKFSAILDKYGIEHTQTKAWTTDAFFRETPEKVKRRKAVGCQVVDMEWSAVAAWAQFRQKDVYHFFYTSDFVDHENGWDKRGGHDEDDLLTFFRIALKIAKEIEND